MKIAIIGSGNLGLSIAKGLVYNNTYTSLYLTKRDLSSIENWKEYNNVKITSDNKEAVKNSDIIIFTVQPSQFDSILDDIKEVLNDKHVLISAITGFSIGRMEDKLDAKYPIIRSMPNTAISVGKSMTCLCSNVVGEKRIAIAEAIFNGLGTTIKIEEDRMQAGVQMGFDADESMQMSMHTALGAASLLIETNSHPEKEIDKVTTPKGCTITGLNEMEHQGLSSSLIKGLMASFEKINEIKIQ